MNRLNEKLPFGLPAGLRLMVTDAVDYTVPYGTIGTLAFDEALDSNLVFLTFDGDPVTCGFPLKQLRIVGYSGKKMYKRDGNGVLIN